MGYNDLVDFFMGYVYIIGGSWVGQKECWIAWWEVKGYLRISFYQAWDFCKFFNFKECQLFQV